MAGPTKSSISTQAVRGAAWTIATGLASRALGLIGTLALTYFLSPETQGEVSVAFILVVTAQQLSGFGAGQYLVASPKADRAVTWNVMLFLLAAGVLFLGTAVLLRHPFARWLSAPTMGRYVPGLAVAMMIERCSVVPERLLARQLRFRPIALARTLGEIVYTVLSVALAMLGMGGMAVVIGNICRNVVCFFILARATPREEWLTPAPLSTVTIRRMLAYGLPLSASTFASFASRRWDNLIVAWSFGTETVGLYNKAYELADIPATQIGEQIGDVLFPSFSQMNPEDRKRALVRATGLLALIVFPLAVGLGTVSTTIVGAVMPPAWAAVAPMLTILSGLSVVRPLGWTVSAYLQASNMPRAAMWLGLAKVVFLMTALLTIGRLGPLWACGAVGIAFAGHSLASMAVVQHFDRVRVTAVLARCAPPLLACAPMVVAILAVRFGLSRMGIQGPRLRLPIEVVVGGLAYVASASVIAGGITRELISLVRDAATRQRLSVPPQVAQ